MNKKKVKSGITKKGKRRTNRRLCTQYAEQVYKELTSFFASEKMEIKFSKISLENLFILKDPTWLGGFIDGVYYGLKMCAYSRHNHFEYSYRIVPLDRKLKTIEPQWSFTFLYKIHSPHEIVEIINLAHHLYRTYEKIDTIEEMEEIVRTHYLSCIGARHGDADDDKLTELFMAAHQLSDDRFGLTYYFINQLCIRTLSSIFWRHVHVEDDDSFFYDDDDDEDNDSE